MTPGPGGGAVVRPEPNVYVQTRGTPRATDYAFLGGAPPQAWWRDYRDATAFDHPTVLVTSDGACWAAYLSGIPSARTDAVGTVIRYTLATDGPCGDPAVAPGLVAAVAAWLDDLAGGRPAGGSNGRPAAGSNERPAAGSNGRPAAGSNGRPAAGSNGRPAAGSNGRLAAVLDARFPPADVQRLLDDPPPGGGRSIGEPGRRVLDALADLPVPSPGTDAPGSWIGGIGAPAARAAFVARVAALVGGAPGRALLLNLVGGPDDLAAVPADPHPAAGRGPASLAVLVETPVGAGDGRPAGLPAGVEAKKAPAPPTGAPGPTPRTPAAGTPAVGTSAVGAVSDGARLVVVATLMLVALAVTVLLLL